MKSGSEVIEVNLEELTALLERARQGPLGEEDCRRLEAAIHALSCLIEKIGEKNTTISQLRALLMKPSTGKTRKVLEQAGIKTSPPYSSPPPADPQEKPQPGHGRNGEAAYRGAERIKIPHGALKPGDHCPKCRKGKVYPKKEPGLRIRVTGQAPLAAKVWELERLRCNLCGEVFEAEAPDGIGEKKDDESAAAMIGLLRYGSGVPFYRLAGLEASLGIPLAASTPWEIVAETAKLLRPAFEELIRQAAQGEVLHNDDTAMKVLTLARANPRSLEQEEAPGSKERTGLFTSGIVATRQGQRRALFFTGRRHAPGRTSRKSWPSEPRGSRRPFRLVTHCRATCRRSWKPLWDRAMLTRAAASWTSCRTFRKNAAMCWRVSPRCTGTRPRRRSKVYRRSNGCASIRSTAPR